MYLFLLKIFFYQYCNCDFNMQLFLKLSMFRIIQQRQAI